jgi:hypothetical protein
MSEEIFMQNLMAFRRYAIDKGAYFDSNGWLIYRGKILTRSDTEYLDQSDTPYERLLDESEIQAMFDNLVDYAQSEVDES